MAIIKQSIWVPYTAAEMYELVNAIEQYPEFLPWCRKAEVHSRTEHEVRATIQVFKGGVHRAFTTLNRLQHNKMIEVRLVNGPFRVLHGYWRFEEEKSGTKISFDLEFEFLNKLIALAATPFIHKAADNCLQAFCQRAKELYG